MVIDSGACETLNVKFALTFALIVRLQIFPSLLERNSVNDGNYLVNVTLGVECVLRADSRNYKLPLGVYLGP